MWLRSSLWHTYTHSCFRSYSFSISSQAAININFHEYTLPLIFCKQIWSKIPHPSAVYQNTLLFTCLEMNRVNKYTNRLNVQCHSLIVVIQRFLIFRDQYTTLALSVTGQTENVIRWRYSLKYNVKSFCCGYLWQSGNSFRRYTNLSAQRTSKTKMLRVWTSG